MKTTLPYLTAAALAVGTLATAEAQIGIGLRGGILTTSEKIDDFDDASDTSAEVFDESNVTGWTIGIPIEIAISNVFSIQPELNFQARGTEFTQLSTRGFGVGGADVRVLQDFEQDINYLEIPLLFKLGYTTEKFTVAAVAGPSVSFALSGERTFSNYRLESEGTAIGPDIAQTVDIDFDRDGRKRVDFGGHLGAQFGIPAGPGKIMLDGRYQVGFTNLNDGNDDNNTDIDDYDATEQGFSLTLGYMITLGDY